MEKGKTQRELAEPTHLLPLMFYSFYMIKKNKLREHKTEQEWVENVEINCVPVGHLIC